MEPETMRSITAWLLLASVHQEPVPSHVTAVGSCAQVTRPGTTPRGTPSGASVGSNREERMLLAAAIDMANCRRVISIFGSISPKVLPDDSRQLAFRCVPPLGVRSERFCSMG